MWDSIRKLSSAVLLIAAILENAYVVHYVTEGVAAAQHDTDCMSEPLSQMAALTVYLATVSSSVAAIWFYNRVSARMTDVWERLPWITTALAFVPPATMLLGVLGLLLGPIGCFVAGLGAAVIPFLILERLLQERT